MKTNFSLIALSIFIVFSAAASNWPAWRGPEGTGVSSEKNLPLKWSADENVHWRVPLPDAGNSSPIIWGKRVFISQAVEKDHRRTVMCFERETGKLLWQSGVTYTEEEPTQESNPYCSGTPATDGKRVYACFGSAGIYAYDFDGKEVWHRDLGKLNHMFGNAISPVIVGDLVVVNFGPCWPQNQLASPSGAPSSSIRAKSPSAPRVHRRSPVSASRTTIRESSRRLTNRSPSSPTRSANSTARSFRSTSTP